MPTMALLLARGKTLTIALLCLAGILFTLQSGRYVQLQSTLSIPGITIPETTTPKFEATVHYSSFKRRIAYIKTHKTGSATIWTILANYAIDNRLRLALPALGVNKLGWPKSFNSSIHVRNATSEPADILCHHSRLSEDMVNYMSGALFITSLRDPKTHFVSAYNYYDADRCTEMAWDEFLALPDKHKRSLLKICHGYRYYLENGQLYDLGMSFDDMSSRPRIHRYIEYLNRTLNFVIILEHFDESLIVLRDLLGWSTEDIVYLKRNERADKFRTDNKTQVSLGSWNNADQLLYDFFYAKLKLVLHANPQYYHAEVKKLKHHISHWKDKCVENLIPSSLQVHNKYLDTNIAGIMVYNLTESGYYDDTCVRLIIPNVPKQRLLVQGINITSELIRSGWTI